MDSEKVYSRHLSHIRKMKVHAGNKEDIENFVKWEETSGKKPRTIETEIRVLRMLAEFAGSKPFRSLTKRDVLDFLDNIEN